MLSPSSSPPLFHSGRPPPRFKKILEETLQPVHRIPFSVRKQVDDKLKQLEEMDVESVSSNTMGFAARCCTWEERAKTVCGHAQSK